MRSKIILIAFLTCLTAFIYSCQSPSEIEQQTYFVNGMNIYKIKCQSCHGEAGQGLEGLVPPLTDTTFLTKNKNQLACIIKNGMQEPIEINGRKFEGKMPGNPTLADIDIAQLIVYVTNSFGNKQGMFKYTEVAKSLQQCP